MSWKHAIVTFPQRQIQLAARENNNRCETHHFSSSSSLCPSQPAGWKHGHCRALCQVKRQMGKGEGFRATRHGGPGSSFYLHPPWGSILNTFTDRDFTYRNVSAGGIRANTFQRRLRPGKGLSSLSPQVPIYTKCWADSSLAKVFACWGLLQRHPPPHPGPTGVQIQPWQGCMDSTEGSSLADKPTHKHS